MRVCAQDDCREPLGYVLSLDETIPLAYACDLSHLREIMRATAHLGSRRRIELLEGS